MRGAWAGSLGLSLGLVVAAAQAQDSRWRPTTSAAAPGSRVPVATLGRPEPVIVPVLPGSSTANGPLTRAGYQGASIEAPRTSYAQDPGMSGPSLAPPPGVAPIPGSPEERYNCGVVNGPPGAKKGFWDKCKGCFDGVAWTGGAGGRALFQSDHCFDEFSSPPGDPFLFEDPRSLTELRPIFIFQQAPGSNWIFQGHNVYFFGTQARVALTDRMSIVMNKLGGTWMNPNNHVAGFENASGFDELWMGPKYTFLRNEASRTVAAGGLTFQIPIGNAKVFQDVGVLTLNPYLSVAQAFGRSEYGSFDFMNTSGFALATDNKRSNYGYSSFHLDYNIVNANKFYPMVELCWFNYYKAGTQNNFQFEGRDLFNFGSQGVSGRNYLIASLGGRWNIRPWAQWGTAFGTPIMSPRDIYAFRITTDMIFRY